MGGYGTLTSCVLRYLQDKNRYAILIDGPWGSGKTYYVEHELRREAQEAGFRVCRATLYGVESVGELAARILQSYVAFDDAGSSAGAADVTNSLLKILGDVLSGVTGLELNVNAPMIVPMLSWNDKVLVLDDLERRIDGHDTELMGYINELVDRVGCKIVFVSNYDVHAVNDRSLEKLIWERYRFKPDMQEMIDVMLGEHLSRTANTSTFKSRLIHEVNRRGCNNVRALIRLRPIFEMVEKSRFYQDEHVRKEVRLSVVFDAIRLALPYAEDVFGESDPRAEATAEYKTKPLIFIPDYYSKGVWTEGDEVAKQLVYYGEEFVEGSAERKAAQESIDLALGDDAYEDEEGLMAVCHIRKALLQEDLGMEQIPMAMRAVGRLRTYGLLDDEDVRECDSLAERFVLKQRGRARESMLKINSLWARNPELDKGTWDYPGRSFRLCDKVLRGESGINGVVNRGLEEGDHTIAKTIASWIVESTGINMGPVRLDQLDLDLVVRAIEASDARSICELNNALGSIAHRASSVGDIGWSKENESWTFALSNALDGVSPKSKMCRRELDRLRQTLNRFAN